MFFQKYRIATRVSIVAFVILFLMMLLAGLEIHGLNTFKMTLDAIVGNQYQRLSQACTMRIMAGDISVIMDDLLIEQQAGRESGLRQELDRIGVEYMSLLANLEEQDLSEIERQRVGEVETWGSRLEEHWSEISQDDGGAVSSPLMGAGVDNEKTFRQMRNKWFESLDKLMEIERQLVDQAVDTVSVHQTKFKAMLVMISILAVLVGLFLVVAITRSIVVPLREISRRIDLISRGDFSTRIDLDQEGEVGQLANHINMMVEKLKTNEEELNEYRYNLEELIEWRTGEMNDQRERFISVLIHDLKGSLIPVIGFSRLLMKKKHLSFEQVSEYASAIHDSAGKLSYSIEQTSSDLREKRLAYSFDKAPFDMEDLLLSVSKGCLAGFGEKKLGITLNGKSVEGYRSGERLLYYGDIGKIRSLFENLISNAGKYAETSVQIRLTTRNNSLVCTIDDDGCGIKEEYRKKIFEEYYQVPGSKNGTGIGLYSVRRVVEHYQGEISIDDSPSGGSRFVVSLPMVQ